MIQYEIFEEAHTRNRELRGLLMFNFSTEPMAGDTLELGGKTYVVMRRHWSENGGRILIVQECRHVVPA